jgi:signal peptidase II
MSEPSARAKYRLYATIAVVGVILDQISKFWVMGNIRHRAEEIVIIEDFFSLVHTTNTGAAFGMLAGVAWAMYFFYVFTAIAVGVLIKMLMEIPNEDRYQTWALGLITSGAIGNFIDRVHKQGVTDFLHVHIEKPEGLRDWLISTLGTNVWPSFNVADSAICVGLCMFVIHFLFLEKDEEVEPEPAEELLDDVQA